MNSRLEKLLDAVFFLCKGLAVLCLGAIGTAAGAVLLKMCFDLLSL